MQESAVLDRRTRKKLATYRALATAARELTLERGLDGVTVADIAEAADVSVRTFFNYFASKEQAIIGLEPGVAESLAAEVAARPPGEDPLTALVAVLLHDTGEEMTAVAQRWMMRSELARRYPALLPDHLAALATLQDALVGAVAARLGVDASRDLYPTTLVSATIATIRSTIAWWHQNDGPVPLTEAIDEAVAILANGFAAQARPAEAPPAADRATGGPAHPKSSTRPGRASQDPAQEVDDAHP